jgi:hypothetical protein
MRCNPFASEAVRISICRGRRRTRRRSCAAPAASKAASTGNSRRSPRSGSKSEAAHQRASRERCPFCWGRLPPKFRPGNLTSRSASAAVMPFTSGAAAVYPVSARTQFSHSNSAIRENSRSLSVTSVSPKDMLWAAMSKSLPPIGWPFFSRSARIRP